MKVLWRWGKRPVRPGADRDGGAAAVFSGRQRLALLAVFALLVILRLPHAWLQGRFLDEEGSIFFAFAWHRPAFASLFRSFGGYLNIGANATTLLDARLVQAGIVPLERAPYLTMTLALLFQLLPAVLILTGRARWLANRWAVLGCLLILVLDPMTEEVFVNVLHIQFHLALCAALILALDVPASRRVHVCYGAVLFLAPLCGPGAIVLLPFFVLRALIDRSPARLTQTAVFAVGTALQLLVFFSPSPVRGQFLDPATLAAIMFVRLVAMPFGSSVVANVIGKWMYDSYVGGGIGWWCVPVLSTVYFAGLVGVALRHRRDSAIWLIVPGLAIAAASFGGGMITSDPSDWFSVGAGERYNFLPLALLGFGLVVLALRPRARFRRVFVVLCMLTVVSGAIAYPQPIEELSQGPVWADEVARWQRDHRHQLVVWPASWSVDLSDRSRPCPPPTTGARITAPSYCESVWLARVARHSGTK